MLAIACGRPANATETPRSPEPRAAIADASVDTTESLADDLPRLARRAKELFVEWAAAFKDPNLDCATATSRVNALADKYADVSAANRAVYRAGRERVRALRAELDKHEAEMAPAAKALIDSPIMSRCAPTAEFARAVDRLQGDA